MSDTFVYGTALKHLSTDVSWATDTIKMGLLVPPYVFDVDEEFWSQVQPSEMVNLTGYSPGGDLLTSRAVVYDAGSNRVEYQATAGITFPSLTTALTLVGWGVVYADTGDPATSPLIQAVQFAGQTELNGAAITLSWADDSTFSVG